MSMKPPVDSNTEGARNTDLIPIQSEHELGKLLMNANQHEKHRKAHFERNERLPVRQPANRMEGGHHRGKIPVDRRSSLSAQVFQISPQRKRHSADVSGEGNFDGIWQSMLPGANPTPRENLDTFVSIPFTKATRMASTVCTISMPWTP